MTAYTKPFAKRVFLKLEGVFCKSRDGGKHIKVRKIRF
jgi:hypothetical protein